MADEWLRPTKGLVAMLLLVLSGCIGDQESLEDVTHDKRFWGGYRPGGRYQLVQDVFVYGRPGEQAFLVKPETKYGTENPPLPSLGEYRADPAKWPDIRGITSAGQPLEVTKFVCHSRLTWSTLEVHAKPSGGTFSGADVRIDYISKPETEAADKRAPDPLWLWEVAPPTR